MFRGKSELTLIGNLYLRVHSTAARLRTQENCGVGATTAIWNSENPPWTHHLIHTFYLPLSISTITHMLGDRCRRGHSLAVE